MAIQACIFDAYGTLYDGQSIAATLDAAFPGRAEYVTQVWRMKQLEYSWLRSLMRRYVDFRAITRDALRYSLDTIGITPDEAVLDRIVDAYDNLSPYPEAAEALGALSQYRLAILSNGSPDMLDALVRNSGLDLFFEAVISVAPKQTYKPDPRAYELVHEQLGVRPEESVFVTSNGFDVAGACNAGFKVVRIERVTQAALRAELAGGSTAGPAAMFRALRTQTEALDFRPHAVVDSLTALPSTIRGFDSI